MLSGVVPCFEPSRLVRKAQEAIAVSWSGYGPPDFAHSVTLDHVLVLPALLPTRYGPHAAVQHVYGCPGLLKAVTRGAPRRSHDALALGLLRALCEGGCGAGGQTDAVLVPAAAAGHVAVAQWAMQVGYDVE